MSPEQQQELRFQVRQALRELGDTPEQVAAQLQELGCRGRRAGYETCPLALYLRRISSLIWVGRCAVFFGRERPTLKLETLPDAAFLFRAQFDCGAYPFLEISDGNCAQ